jgi:hypothetical protein
VHKCGDEGGKSKTLDDYCPEVGDPTIGDVANDSKEKKKVEFVVSESFSDLIPL